MRATKIFAVMFLLAAFCTSCGMNENPPYDLKFFHIMVNETSLVNVSSKANMIGTYNVYMSTPATNETVTLMYELIVGDGLTEGVDFRLLNTGNSLTFLPGIYDMPIRIQWMANPVDPTKDNTLKIRLVSNDKGYAIGLPGPDHLQSVLTITKI
jgi:hypothetical protein